MTATVTDDPDETEEQDRRRRSTEREMPPDIEPSLLAQVARQLAGYDEDWRALYEAIGLSRDETSASVVANRVRELVAAERQLDEARAALTMVAHYGDAFPEGTDMLAACRDVAARVLSGETT